MPDLHLLGVSISAYYAPFVLSLSVVVLIGVLELVGLLTSGWSVLATLDWDSPDADSHLPEVLDWIWVKGLPLTVYLVLLLSVFGASGAVIQGMAEAYSEPLALVYAVPLAGIAALYCSRLIGQYLVMVFATDTAVTSQADLIGLRGTVLSPTIEYGRPGEVRVDDKHGKSHYLWCEPLTPDEVLKEFDLVYIKNQKEHLYFVSKI